MHNLLNIYTISLKFRFSLADLKTARHQNKVLKNLVLNKHFIIPDKKSHFRNISYHNQNHTFLLSCNVKYSTKKKFRKIKIPLNLSRSLIFPVCFFKI